MLFRSTGIWKMPMSISLSEVFCSHIEIGLLVFVFYCSVWAMSCKIPLCVYILVLGMGLLLKLNVMTIIQNNFFIAKKTLFFFLEKEFSQKIMFSENTSSRLRERELVPPPKKKKLQKNTILQKQREIIFQKQQVLVLVQ
jgi:hypothetical protein